MKLRAIVKGSTGKTKHTVGEFIEGKLVPITFLPVPSWVEISKEDGAFYLFHFDAEGVCFADTWHRTLDEAKHQAEFEFGISEAEWTPVVSTDNGS